MKNTLVLALMFFTVISLSGQEKYKTQIGLKLHNYSRYYMASQRTFSLIYKKQISESKFRRIDFGLIRGYSNGADYLAINVDFGIEKHIPLAKKLDFTHGTMYHLGYSTSDFGDTYKHDNFSVGIGYQLGLEYKLTKRLTLGASVTPMLMSGVANQTRNGKEFGHQFLGIGFNSNVAIHMTYNFNWKKPNRKAKKKKY